MALKYPDILQSNNPAAYGIVPATEVSGHKQVANLTALYALADPILSLSGKNTNNDAIGQLWYVASEGKHYQLVDWANRKNANGWKVFKSGGGSKSLPFAGYMDSDITVKEEETATPTAIYWRSALNTFIALGSDGTYYFGWKETDTIPAREDYLTTGNSFINTSNNTLYISTNNQLSKATRPRVPYGTCSTAANVAEKAITLHPDFADWKLEVGAEFVVKFDTTNSATDITLNVNGTGAKRVWYNQSVVSAVQVMICQIQRPERYMYDGTNYVWIGHALDYYKDYAPKSLGFGYGICSTGAADTAKVATLSGYALFQNGIVAVKFTNAVPANATLNINGKGAKPIFYRGSAIVAGVINAGDVATFIYDGTNYIYLGTDNALSRAGGKINGELVIADETDDVVEIDAQGITLRDTSDDSQPQTKITHAQVESNVIKKVGGTSDQVLMADGSVAGTITTDWLEANLT
jgi:hypothetical protein